MFYLVDKMAEEMMSGIALLVSIVAILGVGFLFFQAPISVSQYDDSQVFNSITNLQSKLTSIESTFRSDINTLSVQVNRDNNDIYRYDDRYDDRRYSNNDLDDVEDDIDCLRDYYDEENNDFGDIDELQDCLNVDNGSLPFEDDTSNLENDISNLFKDPDTISEPVIETSPVAVGAAAEPDHNPPDMPVRLLPSP